MRSTPNPYKCALEVSKESSNICDLYRVHKQVSADAEDRCVNHSIPPRSDTITEGVPASTRVTI